MNSHSRTSYRLAWQLLANEVKSVWVVSEADMEASYHACDQKSSDWQLWYRPVVLKLMVPREHRIASLRHCDSISGFRKYIARELTVPDLRFVLACVAMCVERKRTMEVDQYLLAVLSGHIGDSGACLAAAYVAYLETAIRWRMQHPRAGELALSGCQESFELGALVTTLAAVTPYWRAMLAAALRAEGRSEGAARTEPESVWSSWGIANPRTGSRLWVKLLEEAALGPAGARTALNQIEANLKSPRL